MTDDGTDRHLKLFTGLLLAAGVLGIAAGFVAAWPGETDLLTGISDEAMYFPLALKRADPELFPRDEWVEKGGEVFHSTYLAILAPLVSRADRMIVVSHGIAVAAAIVFLSGVLLLMLRATGVAPAAALAVALLAIPWVRKFGIAPGDGLGRDLFHAAVPWILLLALEVRARGPWAHALLGLTVGLLTNLHPLNGLQFGTVLGGVVLLSHPGRAGLGPAASLGAGFLVGSAPFVASFLSFPRTGEPSAEALRLRAPNVVAEGLERIAARWVPIVLMAGAVLLLRLRGLLARGFWARLLVVAGVLGLAGVVAGRVAYPVAQFQFGRLWRLAGLLAVLATAALLSDAACERGRRRVLAALGALALVLLIPLEEPLLERLGRRLSGHPPPPSFSAPGRDRLGEPSRWPPEDRRAFLEVCDWIRRETPKDALFLVPPENYGLFRACARRSVVVTRKEGSFAVTFLGSEGERWLDLYRRVVELYRNARTTEFRAFAAERGVDYVLAELPRERLDLAEVHRAGPLVVYALSGED